MCKSHITAQKLLKLLCVRYFYTITIYLLFLGLGREVVSFRRLFSLFSPLGGSISSGFISCFLLFFLLIPFLNAFLENLGRSLHLKLVLLLLGVFSFATVIPYFSVYFNYVTWFSILYITVAYLRFYPNRLTNSLKWTGSCMALSVFLAMCFSVILPNILTAYINKRFVYFIYYFTSDSNQILALTTGISSFLFFKNLRMPYSKVINAIGSTTFGVLCIHANSNAMRSFLWKDLFKNGEYYDSSFFLIHSFGVVLLVFTVCSIIDFTRIIIFEPGMMSFSSSIASYIRNNFQKKNLCNH